VSSGYIPVSVLARAEALGVNPSWELWHEIIRAVRDAALLGAQKEGLSYITLVNVVPVVADLYPWISDERDPEATREEGSGSDRYRTGMAALTYGVGARFWEMNFYEADGETVVSSDEIARVLRAEDRERMAQIILRWDINPSAEIPHPIEKKVARVVAPEED
jgi:hypothetical protein